MHYSGRFGFPFDWLPPLYGEFIVPRALDNVLKRCPQVAQVPPFTQKNHHATPTIHISCVMHRLWLMCVKNKIPLCGIMFQVNVPHMGLTKPADWPIYTLREMRNHFFNWKRADYVRPKCEKIRLKRYEYD